MASKQPSVMTVAAIGSIPLIMTLGNSMLIPVLPKMQSELHLTSFQGFLRAAYVFQRAFSVYSGPCHRQPRHRADFAVCKQLYYECRWKRKTGICHFTVRICPVSWGGSRPAGVRAADGMVADGDVYLDCLLYICSRVTVAVIDPPAD